MAKIRPLSDISEKYASVTPLRSEEYRKGVENPTTDWKAATIAATANHTTATQLALSQGRFAKGVAASSTQAWQEGAIQKGAVRFGPGVALAQPAYEAGFAPYHAVISATNLPARGPKGSPGNIQRVAVLAAALNAKKVGRG